MAACAAEGKLPPPGWAESGKFVQVLGGKKTEDSEYQSEML